MMIDYDFLYKEWTNKNVALNKLRTELTSERQYHHIALNDKQRQIDKLREALEFYANAENYKPEIVGRIGAFTGIARLALKETEE